MLELLRHAARANLQQTPPHLAHDAFLGLGDRNPLAASMADLRLLTRLEGRLTCQPGDVASWIRFQASSSAVTVPVRAVLGEDD